MAAPHPHLLLVEGDEDKRVIPYLMDRFIVWGNSPKDWVVDVKAAGSISELIDSSFIDNEFSRSNLQVVGIVADANADPQKRWQAVRNKCIGFFPAIPEELPKGGLIHTNSEGLRLGVWLMPDNESPGMLESFLANFAIDQGSGFWPAVCEYCQNAKLVHYDKALIHSWLAVQDPPGQQLHSAILQKILTPCSALAEPFVKWFCDLFHVQMRPESVI